MSSTGITPHGNGEPQSLQKGTEMYSAKKVNYEEDLKLNFLSQKVISC